MLIRCLRQARSIIVTAGGQMSAWYIFAALGFYPVNPVAKELVIGSCVLSLSLLSHLI